MPPFPFAASTLPQWIGNRATRHGDRIAITFLDDDGGEQSWSYAELWNRSCRVASLLPPQQTEQPRALLLYRPGIEFMSGFLGCQIAGWVPVPTCYPRGGREMKRLDSVATDCQPAAILGDAESLSGLDSDQLCSAAAEIPRIATDTIESSDPAGQDSAKDAAFEIDPNSLRVGADDLALLQYTSGSTSEPKGVMVRHRNMLSNLEAIRQGFQISWQADDAEEPDCGVFWLPFFHDMGLIGGILEPLYVGGRSILMSPRAFLQRPIRWLQRISDFRAVISGAPNFAYQLCVDRISPDQADSIDLSRWRIAFSGAEPVLPRTIYDFSNRFGPCGFAPTAFVPCYGLAEATLLAACAEGPSEPNVLSIERESLSRGRPVLADASAKANAKQKIVSCGRPALETELLIVDPNTSEELASADHEKSDGSQMVVGEIWLRGPSVTAGYWNRETENDQRFGASLSDGRSGFCRTGDLGFLHGGELFITGRLKDLIIIGGRNLFPQDIEETISKLIGANGGKSVAFSVEAGRSEALALIVELPRPFNEANYPELVRSIRRVVIEIHEIDPRHVLLVRQATIPLTSSGKVQRSRCRERFHEDDFKCRHRYDRTAGSLQTPIPIPDLPSNPQPADRPSTLSAIESWMVEWLIARGGVQPADVDLKRPFAEYGLDSMTAVEMSGEIEDWSGVELTPMIAWDHPTVSSLSGYITDQLLSERPGSPGSQSASGNRSPAC